MNDQHTKVLHEGTKNRLRYAGSRKRSVAATADVYRSSKKGRVVTSASSREDRVHHPAHAQRQSTKTSASQRNGKDDTQKKAPTAQDLDLEETTFASELDVALDRNASEIFSKCHRSLWPLVRSLPEVLHHAEEIVDLLLSYLLSPVDKPGEQSPIVSLSDNKQRRGRFVVNYATTDVLHLIAVFARDLRHELHPYLHTKLLPRIIYDLVNPPIPLNTQPVPLDVTIVEAAFRCISYIFRYDSDALLEETFDKGKPCLEGLRQYYGVTLASKRELVRRLAAETFSSVIRKLKHDSSKRRHLRRVLHALAASCGSQKATLDRLQSDAVDGIAKLLYHTAFSSTGRLNSKSGKMVVATVLDVIAPASKEADGQQLIFSVATSFFNHLCQVLALSESSDVASTVVAFAKGCDDHVSLAYLLDLVQFMTEHRNGSLLRRRSGDGSGQLVEQLEGLLSFMLEHHRFTTVLTASCRQAALSLLFSTLQLERNNTDLGRRIMDESLRFILTVPVADNPNTNVAFLVVRDLIPCYLPECAELAMETIGTPVLSTAADIATDNPTAAMHLVHALASVKGSSDYDHDDVCFLDRAGACELSDDETEKLLNCVLWDEQQMSSDVLDNEICANLAACCKAAGFLAAVGGDTSQGIRSEANYARVSSWLIRVIKLLQTHHELETNASVVASMAIQSLSNLSRLALGYLKTKAAVAAVLVQSRALVQKHLMANPSSLWALKSVSLFVSVLHDADESAISDDVDSIFESLVSNLRDRNHFCRLHTLEILSSFPKRPFVVDHADLDLADDLDEESTGGLTSHEKQQSVSTSRLGLCTILDTLLAIESMPANLEMERQLLSRISSVGVLGRTGKLPVVYAEACAAHMLGLLSVKFAPIWPIAVKALVSLAAGHEASVWPMLHDQIRRMMVETESENSERGDTQTDMSPDLDPCRLFELYMAWEASRGNDCSLFADDLAKADEQGQVSRHHSTDDTSVFESLWSVVAGAPQLVTAHSRTIVPIFFRFINDSIPSDDPDVRELCLDKLLADIDDSAVRDGESCVANGRQVQHRLKCMLNAFAEMNGPQQLYKHDKLLSIFVALLSYSNNDISKSAFACVLKYKITYVQPYAHMLKLLYEKGQLREALMQLSTLSESGSLPSEHRAHIIPVLSRILFGRLAARATGATKDTPQARRNAILSFLSSFCASSDELYPFMYLMMRAYVPKNVQAPPVELHDFQTRRMILDSISSSTTCDLGKRQRVHQGFLNLLEAVVKQHGQKITPFVPCILSILVGLCKGFAVQSADAMANDESHEDQDEGVEATDHTDRSGSIRSLCYRRLADMIPIVGSGFSKYSTPFWSALQDSLVHLPEMAASADKCPSLLLLLRVLAGDSSLVKMFYDNSTAVPSVLKCLSEGSKPPVVEATLVFIECLLEDAEGDVEYGRNLLRDHAGLLLSRFQLRVHLKPIAVPSRRSNKLSSDSSATSTWRRELAVLCRVSDLITSSQDNPSNQENNTMAQLCELLIPYLDHKFGVSDSDRHNVLMILEKMISKIPPVNAVQHFDKLSELLGPLKAKRRLTSRVLRKSLASTIRTLAVTSYEVADKATLVLLHLSSLNAKRVDEMDYDMVIPALSDLGKSAGLSTWSDLSTSESNTEPRALIPVIQTCFHFLFDEDGVVSRAAFKALQALVVLANERGNQTCQHDDGQKWDKLLDGLIVPMIRSGLDARIESVRRFFILLLKDVVRGCNDSAPPGRHSDLKCIIRDDEPDLDFFQNFTHVQIHRRARALQRVRSLLSGPQAQLSQHTLSAVMLPLSTHPVYECKMKIEESFATEGVETVGAIAMHLSWKQYSAVLWTHLNQVTRHPDREKLLIALICKVIDAFHFDVESKTTETSADSNSVLRALESRIIPKVESLLVTDKLEKKGGMVRSSVVLALLKLFRKLPVVVFEAKLPRLLSVVVAGLKDRDSNARDTARMTLARMVVEMGISYLSDVTRELATSLTEGFKLHVRNACIHTILLEVSNVYKPPSTVTERESYADALPKFDQAVPALMDLIQQDVFGETQEKRDAQGIKARYVKEAGGSKSTHSLELLASMIFFHPSSVSGASQLLSSSVHVMVSPMLERLRSPQTSTTVARRVKECLLRIVVGLSRNPSVQPTEVLPFVRVTLEMFVGKHEIAHVMESMEDDDDSDEDNVTSKPIHVSGGNKPIEKGFSTSGLGVAVWQPSTLKAVKTTKAAHKVKLDEETAMTKVQDGASAPKLTGSRRVSSVGQGVTATVNDPGTICGVVFGLQLLNPTLKNAFWGDDTRTLLDPFVPLLTTCVCRCRDTDVVLLALRCLGYLLKSALPSLLRCSRSLSSKTLDLLVSSANQELTQASFKMLTLLISLEPTTRGPASLPVERGEDVLVKSESLPLDSEQLQVLTSFLREAVVSSDQHHPAIALIKALMNRHYTSAEFYDLMEVMLEQSVRSPQDKLRDQSGFVFVNYLLNYPLSKERMEQHFKQVVLNISYEYSEGRLSAIGLLSSLLQKLPEPLVEQHCRLFFLPLTMQLVNDDSKECREAVANCIDVLLSKISTEFLQSLYGYIERWSTGNDTFRRTSLQLFAIFVNVSEARKVIKPKKLLELVCDLTTQHPDNWEIVYFALILVEALAKCFAKQVVEFAPIWEAVINSLANRHAWIKLTSVRLLTSHLQDPVHAESARTHLSSHTGSLYSIARNLCFQLGADELEQDEDLTALAIKGLAWTLNIMASHPELSFEADKTSKESDPVKWLFTRLSNIARAKGTKRRQSVFKCFAAFATMCGPAAFKHLELMLEPLHRVEIETRNELEPPSVMFNNRQSNEAVSEEAQFAKDVLHLLEEKCEPQEMYWKAYATVTARARDKSEKRKAETKIEAVADPQNAAKRRMDKNDREKNRRKRRVDDRRNARGATAKRQHV